MLALRGIAITLPTCTASPFPLVPAAPVLPPLPPASACAASTAAYTRERALLPLVAYEEGLLAYISESQELIVATTTRIATPSHYPVPAPLVAVLLDGGHCLVLDESGAVHGFDHKGPWLAPPYIVAIPEPVVMLRSGWYGLYFFLGQRGSVYRAGYVRASSQAASIPVSSIARVAVPGRAVWLGTYLTHAAILTATGDAYMCSGLTIHDVPAARATFEGRGRLRFCAQRDNSLISVLTLVVVERPDHPMTTPELSLQDDIIVTAPAIAGRRVHAAAGYVTALEEVVHAIVRMDDGATYHVTYESEGDGSVTQTVGRLPAWSGEEGVWSVPVKE